MVDDKAQTNNEFTVNSNSNQSNTSGTIDNKGNVKINVIPNIDLLLRQVEDNKSKALMYIVKYAAVSADFQTLSLELEKIRGQLILLKQQLQ